MCVQEICYIFNVICGSVASQCQFYKLWTFIKVCPYHPSFFVCVTIISSEGSYDLKLVHESRFIPIIHTFDGTQECPLSSQLDILNKM